MIILILIRYESGVPSKEEDKCHFKLKVYNVVVE